MRSRYMSLLPRTTLHSDSKQLPYITDVSQFTLACCICNINGYTTTQMYITGKLKYICNIKDYPRSLIFPCYPTVSFIGYIVPNIPEVTCGIVLIPVVCLTLMYPRVTSSNFVLSRLIPYH
jgi:hypothetical protein